MLGLKREQQTLPRHLSNVGTRVYNLAPLFAQDVAIWPPHAPNTSELGGWIPGNRSTFCTIFGARMGAGFCDGKRPEARCIHTQVQYGEPVTELGGGKNGSKHNLMSF
jgi:hypothetical protein